ncbi:hypothetical protein [Microseira sp. BLCC-F43]|jgi:hypothetical protein|uniref:hypothetical protein n=1 Tax=Microseira sp. BLCC-F43 TaxID=3153602 RepID=UPI0035B896A6
MSKSSRVAQNYIPKVKLALKRNGFPSQRAFATEMGMCRNTIGNFVNGRPVQHNYFVEISDKLGLDWQAIAYIEESLPGETDIVPNTPPNPSEGNHQNSNIYTNVNILENLVEALKQATQASEAALYTAQRTLDAMENLIEQLKQGV